jgi:hypothetical protein
MRKKELKKRIEVLEQIVSQKVTKFDVRHLKYSDRFEIVAMFHIENRILISDYEYYQMQVDINTITGKTPFEYYIDDLKQTIIQKMSQLLADGQLKDQIGIYVNHPMEIKQ